MNNQNLTISKTKNTKKSHDILNLLPAKKTRQRLKTEMLRVDHAGEFGAVHIYRGQMNALQSASTQRDTLGQIQDMMAQEKIHLTKFNEILAERRIRPSALSVIWQTGGFFMGAVTALISPKSAMACTEAVETVIDKHYDMQINYFTYEKTPDILLEDLKQFQQDELNHKQEAIESHSQDAPFYKATQFMIKTICHSVIKIAHKI